MSQNSKQKIDDRSDLCGASRAPQRNRLNRLPDIFLREEGATHQIVDEPRANRIDADALRAQLIDEMPDQTVQRPFARRIMGAADGTVVQRRRRGHDDDAAAGPELVPGGMQNRIDAVEISIEKLTPFGGPDATEGSRTQGTVSDDDAIEGRLHAGDSIAESLLVREIDPQVAPLRDRRMGEQYQIVAIGAQTLLRRQADAAIDTRQQDATLSPGRGQRLLIASR